jgi:ribosomal RNA-processing protein 17
MKIEKDNRIKRVQEIKFDGDSRKDYLENIKKRKDQNRAKAKVYKQYNDREAKIEERRRKKEEEEQMVGSITPFPKHEYKETEEFEYEDHKNDEKIKVTVEEMDFSKLDEELIRENSEKKPKRELTKDEIIEKGVKKVLKEMKTTKKKPSKPVIRRNASTKRHNIILIKRKKKMGKGQPGGVGGKKNKKK